MWAGPLSEESVLMWRGSETTEILELGCGVEHEEINELILQ